MMNKEDIMTKEEKAFWNNDDIITYFANKTFDFRIKKRLEQIYNRRNKQALDLGCGAGRNTTLLIQLGFNTYACDISKQMVLFTQNLIKKNYNNTRSRVIYGTIEKIPFKDEKFDVVIATGVLHQAKSLKDYKIAIKELSRVMKPNGVVCLNIFTNKELDSNYIKVKKEKYTYITKEGIWMTLLPKILFYKLMTEQGLILEKELAEDVKEEKTGPRVVLRANFVKRKICYL